MRDKPLFPGSVAKSAHPAAAIDKDRARPLAPLLQAVTCPRFGICLFLAGFIVAILVGFGIPDLIPQAFLEESGPVERSTIVMYLVAALCVVIIRLPSLSTLDKIALCILLVAFAAREADLHKALFDISILKARFYNRDGTPHQILIALGVLLPIVFSGLWLVKRYWSRWPAAVRRGQAPAIAVLLFLVTLVASKALDRTPSILLDSGVYAVMPLRLTYVLQSLEEILELLIPVLAILAVIQARLSLAASGSAAIDRQTRQPRT